jgi:hypothetical protein
MSMPLLCRRRLWICVCGCDVPCCLSSSGTGVVVTAANVLATAVVVLAKIVDMFAVATYLAGALELMITVHEVVSYLGLSLWLLPTHVCRCPCSIINTCPGVLSPAVQCRSSTCWRL